MANRVPTPNGVRGYPMASSPFPAGMPPAYQRGSASTSSAAHADRLDLAHDVFLASKHNFGPGMIHAEVSPANEIRAMPSPVQSTHAPATRKEPQSRRSSNASRRLSNGQKSFESPRPMEGGSTSKKGKRKQKDVAAEDEGDESSSSAPKKKAATSSAAGKKRTTSCENCRRRKLKCDRRAPCGACIDRGEGINCTWEDGVQPM